MKIISESEIRNEVGKYMNINNTLSFEYTYIFCVGLSCKITCVFCKNAIKSFPFERLESFLSV